jgi:hypothetical protein
MKTVHNKKRRQGRRMKKKKDPRRMIDSRKSRMNENDYTEHQIGLPEDVRVHYSGVNDPHDG